MVDLQLSHTKDFKNGTSCSLALSMKKVELGIRTGQLSVSTMSGWNIMSSVSGMIFQ